MPEPLDPTDAIFSAFTNVIVRVASFAGVGIGGHVMGQKVLDAPANLTALKAQGFAAIPPMFHIDVSALPVEWLATLIASFAGWTFFYPIVVVGLFCAIMRDADLFTVLFILALAQPIDTFIVGAKYGALAGGDLGLAIALLVVLEIATAALVLWWHRTHDALPVDPQPELDEL